MLKLVVRQHTKNSIFALSLLLHVIYSAAEVSSIVPEDPLLNLMFRRISLPR